MSPSERRTGVGGRQTLDRAEVCVLVLFVVFAAGCGFVAGAALAVQGALRLGIVCAEPDVLAVADTADGVVVRCGPVEGEP